MSGIQFRAGKLQTLAEIAAAGAARAVLKRPLWLIGSQDQPAHVATVARRIEQIARQALKG